MAQPRRRQRVSDNVLKRKTLLLDPKELAQLQLLLGTQTEAEAVRKLIHDFLARFNVPADEEE